MRQLTPDEIKRIQLEILDDVHTFCETHKLHYSLCGGTMIGAVRHKGYIPWDDDIDLMMPRTDYDRFILDYKSAFNEVIDLSAIEVCNEQFIKVSRKGTIMEDIIFKRHLFGVNIDIFPVDGMPENYEPYSTGLQQLHEHVLAICPYYKAAGRFKWYWAFRHILKTLFRNLHGDVLTLKRELNRRARAQLPENSPLSTVIFGDFKIFPFPSALFEACDVIEFEGKSYHCIKDRDLYLRTVYGDYMQLPPEEKRVSHHHYNAFIED